MGALEGPHCVDSNDLMAEREGFEPPIALRLCLISSQVHSTGLCHLSAFHSRQAKSAGDCRSCARERKHLLLDYRQRGKVATPDRARAAGITDSCADYSYGGEQSPELARRKMSRLTERAFDDINDQWSL